MSKKLKIFDSPFEALLYITHRCKFQIQINIRLMFESVNGIEILILNTLDFIPYRIHRFMVDNKYTIFDICLIDFLRYDGKQQAVYIKVGDTL